MSTPLISVIVPVYKVEKYLAKCVDSIVNQTYKNLEIILVDDGSPDGCGKICDDYASKDSRVKVIHKVNGGLSDARNVALDVMQGEYVTFVDSDDYIAGDFIENLYRMIEKTGAQISLTAMNPFYEENSPDKELFSTYKTDLIDCDTALSEMFYQRRIDTCAQAKLYWSYFFKGVRYPKGYLFEDLTTTYKVMLAAKKFAISDYSGYFYLLRNDSIEGMAFKPAKYESCVKIINQLKSDSRQMPPKARKALKSRIVSFAFHVLIQIPKDRVEMRKTLFEFVKENRSGVVFDFNARRKTQVAALLSYGGLFFVDMFSKYGVSRYGYCKNYK